MSVNTAIVLAGGKGTRLKPITDKIPKLLVSVCARPLIYWVTQWLRANNIMNIVLGLAYRKEEVLKYTSEINSSDINIQISEHSVNDGTAIAVRKAVKSCSVLEDNFLVMNGDNIADLIIDDFFSFHLREKRIATILVVPLQCDFGVVEIECTEVVSFREKPSLGSVLVNGGIYIFNKAVIQFLHDGDLEAVTFPELAQQRMLSAYRHDGFWRTVNTLKDIENLEAEFSNKSLLDTICRLPE